MFHSFQIRKKGGADKVRPSKVHFPMFFAWAVTPLLRQLPQM